MIYRGVRCSICSTVHNRAGLIHAKLTQSTDLLQCNYQYHYQSILWLTDFYLYTDTGPLYTSPVSLIGCRVPTPHQVQVLN